MDKGGSTRMHIQSKPEKIEFPLQKYLDSPLKVPFPLFEDQLMG